MVTFWKTCKNAFDWLWAQWWLSLDYVRYQNQFWSPLLRQCSVSVSFSLTHAHTQLYFTILSLAAVLCKYCYDIYQICTAEHVVHMRFLLQMARYENIVSKCKHFLSLATTIALLPWRSLFLSLPPSQIIWQTLCAIIFSLTKKSREKKRMWSNCRKKVQRKSWPNRYIENNSSGEPKKKTRQRNRDRGSNGCNTLRAASYPHLAPIMGPDKPTPAIPARQCLLSLSDAPWQTLKEVIDPKTIHNQASITLEYLSIWV